MANMKKMMQQVATMQRDMQRVQEELASRKVEFSVGGGAVTAVALCDGSLAGLTLRPEAVDPREVELLQDMVLSAVNGALEAARDLSTKEMAKVTAGLSLPGMP